MSRIEPQRRPVIVLGIAANAGVVCIPDARCRDLVEMYKIDKEGGTWGELRKRAPALVKEEIECRYWDQDDIPADADLLNVLEIPGGEEGDWPWPAQDMLDWLPLDIREAFGTVMSTTLNGEFLHIEPARLAELVKALESHEYECRRDDAAVTRASGLLLGE